MSDRDPRWRCTEEVPGFRRSTEWSRRRSFAADAHGCIMVVGLDGPTEYKVVARWIRARGMAPLGLSVSEFDPAIRRVDQNAPRQGARLRGLASRLTALTRPRSQSVGLGMASAQSAEARQSKKGSTPQRDRLTNNAPYKGTSRRCFQDGSSRWFRLFQAVGDAGSDGRLTSRLELLLCSHAQSVEA
jgi:hypothetical protein